MSLKLTANDLPNYIGKVVSIKGYLITTKNNYKDVNELDLTLYKLT